MYLRNPKTTQESRASEAYPEFTRAKRNRRNLPNAYDDKPVGRRADRSWKNSRKTRYRPK